MKLEQSIKRYLDDTLGKDPTIDSAEAITIVEDYARDMIFDGAHVLLSISAFLAGVVESGQMTLTTRKRILDELKQYCKNPLITIDTDIRLDESLMSMDEKVTYLNNYPVINQYYKDGQPLSHTRKEKIEDALGGIGCVLMSGEQVIQELTSGTIESDVELVIKPQQFYLFDTCDEANHREAYTAIDNQLSPTIFNIIEALIYSEKLDIGNSDDFQYSWEIINGVYVQYDEVHRKVYYAKYFSDFQISIYKA